MPHVRTSIRDGVAAELVAAGLCGGEVRPLFAARIPGSKLPAAAVFLPRDAAQTLSTDGLQSRTIELAVQVLDRAASRDDAADSVDAACVTVEATLYQSFAAGALRDLGARRLELRDTQMRQHDAGDRPVAEAVLRFEITIFVSEGDPENPV